MGVCNVCNKEWKCGCEGVEDKTHTSCLNSGSPPYGRLMPINNEMVFAHFCSKKCLDKHVRNTGIKPTFLEDSLLAKIHAQMRANK